MLGENWFLIKNVDELRLTYQIRLLAFMANDRGYRLVIRIPKDAKRHRTLREFVLQMDGVVKIDNFKNDGTVSSNI